MGDMWLCITDSLCYSAESNITLWINYTLITIFKKISKLVCFSPVLKKKRSSPLGTRAAFLEKEWLICRVLHSHWTELCFRVSRAHQRASCLQVFATAVPCAWDAFSFARLHWTNTWSLKTSSVIGPSRKPSLNAPHQPLWMNLFSFLWPCTYTLLRSHGPRFKICYHVLPSVPTVASLKG